MKDGTSPRDIRQTGEYCYTYGPFHKPLTTVAPGERVRVVDGRLERV